MRQWKFNCSQHSRGGAETFGTVGGKLSLAAIGHCGKKTWFSVIVIVEITINGDVGDYSDDDGRDDNRDVKSMRKIDVIRYEAKSQQQVGKQLNN